MKTLFWGIVLTVLALLLPAPTEASVDISIGISLPPPIVFEGPPEVIVLPDTDDVYVVPGLDIDIFFWDGWWWRPWEGRWYRSRYYNRGWVFYSSVPRFYYDVDPEWRVYYRSHEWHGHPWNYERIPDRRLLQNWKTWHGNRYWERRKTWGVQGYRPPPQRERQELRRQRQEEYQQRPEVKRFMQQKQEQQRQRQVREPQREPQRRPQTQEPQRQPQQRPQMREPQRQPQQRPQMQEPQPRQYRPEARQPERLPPPEQHAQPREPQRREEPRHEPGRPEGGEGDRRR